jgi:hypothetical protein
VLTSRCPHCGAYSLFTLQWSVRSFLHGRDRILGGLQCAACSLPVSAVLSLDGERIDRMWPQHAEGKSFDDVPDHIAQAADEAYRCQSIGACRAAVLLARAVIEATAKDKGIVVGSLLQKIDKMRDADLIREHIKEGAHEVRHLGNDMAHGDFVAPTAAADADLILTLMSEVLDEVFQSPARVQRARSARAARSGQSQTGGSA